jgi:predicted nucleotidyltransferase
MIKPEIQELLFQLPNTAQGQALKVFLDEEFDLINDVGGVTTLEEVKGKQIALKTLNKIFDFYVKKPITEKQKNQYV